MRVWVHTCYACIAMCAVRLGRDRFTASRCIPAPSNDLCGAQALFLEPTIHLLIPFPCPLQIRSSTGIGGDCFCLYYDAVTKQVTGINGSGCSPAGLTLERVRADGVTGEKLPQLHAHTVTVPGAAAGWVDTVERHGTLSLSEVLQPAIDLAEQGFPVHSTAAHFWEAGSDKLRASENPHGADMLMADGSAPREGDVMEMPMLAQTFRRLAAKGRDGFYRGEVAEAIVAAVRQRGGVLTMEDLAEHCSRFDDPIHVSYRGTDIWEIPPNGQGLTALMALNILEEFDVAALGHNSAAYLHTLIEALRLSFADTLWHVADPEQNPAPLDALLSKEYARSRAALIQPDRAAADVVRGSPLHSSDTVYFCVVDGKGNACSFINSNYMGFGTGIVPKGCGFTLQNRGANFDLTPGHPNVLAPRKRPYHTIIPGMATRDGELYAAFGVMGGFMQVGRSRNVALGVNHLRFNFHTASAGSTTCWSERPTRVAPLPPPSFPHAAARPRPSVAQHAGLWHEPAGGAGLAPLLHRLGPHRGRWRGEPGAWPAAGCGAEAEGHGP